MANLRRPFEGGVLLYKNGGDASGGLADTSRLAIPAYDITPRNPRNNRYPSFMNRADTEVFRVRGFRRPSAMFRTCIIPIGNAGGGWSSAAFFRSCMYLGTGGFTDLFFANFPDDQADYFWDWGRCSLIQLSWSEESGEVSVTFGFNFRFGENEAVGGVTFLGDSDSANAFGSGIAGTVHTATAGGNYVRQYGQCTSPTEIDFISGTDVTTPGQVPTLTNVQSWQINMARQQVAKAWGSGECVGFDVNGNRFPWPINIYSGKWAGTFTVAQNPGAGGVIADAGPVAIRLSTDKAGSAGGMRLNFVVSKDDQVYARTADDFGIATQTFKIADIFGGLDPLAFTALPG